MPEYFPPRPRKVRILATLRPASRSPEMIRALHLAGADAFRVNMSHGTQEDRAEVIAAIRALEKEVGRPMTILVDLQGPKLRIGTFKEGLAQLGRGDLFVLDSRSPPGDKTRVCLPHRQLFQPFQPGSSRLLAAGQTALRVARVEPGGIEKLG